MKIGLLITLLVFIGCGKKETVPGTGSTVDEFTRGYRDQIGKQGVAKLGETIQIYQDMVVSINGECTYAYSFGERVVINNNPKLIKIYSKDVWKRTRDSRLNCDNSMISENVYRVPAVKLQELYIKSVTKKCGFLREVFGGSANLSFCSQSYLGTTSYRSDQTALFKTTATVSYQGVTYNVVDDSTHLSNRFFWVPYPVTQRTLVNGQERPNGFNKVVLDYYVQQVDQRDYDHIFVSDYYDGWEL